MALCLIDGQSCWSMDLEKRKSENYSWPNKSALLACLLVQASLPGRELINMKPNHLTGCLPMVASYSNCRQVVKFKTQ